MSPPTPTSAPGRGIDIRDALSILAARTERGGEDLASASVPAALKAMGQTIDIAKQMEFAQPNAAGCDCAKNGSATNGADASGANALSEEEKQKHEAVKELRARRGEEIRAQLRTMGVGELLGMIFGAQQERVATYKAFEDGVSTILASGNITTYPALCAKVTATFSVLSDTINGAKATLEERYNRKDISNLISQLQKSEGEKLNLTAALHLERLRLRNSELDASLASGEGDDRTMGLLKEGIQSLERKIAGAVESINEALEELRCIAADESE